MHRVHREREKRPALPYGTRGQGDGLMGEGVGFERGGTPLALGDTAFDEAAAYVKFALR